MNKKSSNKRKTNVSSKKQSKGTKEPPKVSPPLKPTTRSDTMSVCQEGPSAFASLREPNADSSNRNAPPDEAEVAKRLELLKQRHVAEQQEFQLQLDMMKVRQAKEEIDVQLGMFAKLSVSPQYVGGESKIKTEKNSRNKKRNRKERSRKYSKHYCSKDSSSSSDLESSQSSCSDGESSYEEAIVSSNVCRNDTDNGKEEAQDQDKAILKAFTDSHASQQRILSLLQMPQVQLQSFGGEPLEYWNFIRLFNACVAIEADPTAKLTRLLHYTTGKARAAIQGCTILSPADGFKKAMDILEQRFGSNSAIAQSWVQKITMGPVIGSQDNSGIRDLADDLVSGFAILQSIDMEGELCNQSSLQRIVNRLPLFVKGRWRKQVSEIQRKKNRVPKVKDLIKFTVAVAEELNHPVYGNLEQYDSKLDCKMEQGIRNGRYERRGKIKCVASHHIDRPMMEEDEDEDTVCACYVKQDAFENEVRSTYANKGSFRPEWGCILCKMNNHKLTECGKFARLPVQARFDLTQEHHLCRNCLATSQHIAYNCTESGTCSVAQCGRRHHTLLHMSHPTSRHHPENKLKEGASLSQHKAAEEGTTKTVMQVAVKQTVESNSQSDDVIECYANSITQVLLPIVPVKLYNKEMTRSIQVCALLDSGSAGTFCTEFVANELGVAGRSCTYNLATIDDLKRERASVLELVVSDLQNNVRINLPAVFTKPTLNISSQTMALQCQVNDYPHLRGIKLPEVDNRQIHLLIGQDVPSALDIQDKRTAHDGLPYASKSPFGWTLHGPIKALTSQIGNYLINMEQTIDSLLAKFWTSDDIDGLCINDTGWSKEDHSVVQLWKDCAKQLHSGHYEAPIPFQKMSPRLSNTSNREVAEVRLKLLIKKLNKNAVLKDKYIAAMKEYLDKGYAEKVVETEHTSSVWYLPHHSVESKGKPGKIRVVLDCAAQFHGISLNDQVSSGPDLLNSLVGVLMRFREYKVAFCADIETMFYQIVVPESQRNMLRFLWASDNEIAQSVETYRMTRHPFGGIWSPSVANFILQKTADDRKNEYAKEVIDTVRRSFYVDDCLSAHKTEDEAIRVAVGVKALLAEGHFNLTKFVTNSEALKDALPLECQAALTHSMDLTGESVSCFKTLGVVWEVSTDRYTYRTTLTDKPTTRRGILAMAASMYDPLGFAAPYTLQAKRLLQEMVRRGVSWDEEPPEDILKQWGRWREDLAILQMFTIPRCIQADGRLAISYELHHFSDACQYAYGAVSYIRMTDKQGYTWCRLLIAKNRLGPIKPTTIPRMELMGATISVKLDRICRSQLSVPISKSVYWCDSKIVLAYIQSTSKRFSVYVANRLSLIWQMSEPCQWNYVRTNCNPADLVCRGLSATDLVGSTTWINGPEFLASDYTDAFKTEDGVKVKDAELELVKDKPVYAVTVNEAALNDDKCAEENAERHTTQEKGQQPTDRLMSYHSSFFKLKKNVAYYQKFMLWFRNGKKDVDKKLSIRDLQTAERSVIQYIQSNEFGYELSQLSKEEAVGKTSKLFKLCPLTRDGLLCVGGRLSNANLPAHAARPIILPDKHHVTRIIIREQHVCVGHMGIEATLANIRQKYWVIKGRQTVKAVIRDCVFCKKMHSKLMTQKMADLPRQRFEYQEPPFSSTAVDYFGPIEVKIGRSVCKRWGCLFTCLSSRAVHLEVATSLSASAFINAFHRFVSRRSRPTNMWSDNGTNFTAAEKELKENLIKLNKQHVENEMLKQNINWHWNPPSAPHMGGVFERLIRVVKNVMNGICNEQSLTDETLATLLCRVEEILNHRPLTRASDDIHDEEVLTPSHLLTPRGNPPTPPGLFGPTDSYMRRQWRQVEYLTDCFWRRWQREYLPLLQNRSKWHYVRRNIQKGDLVIVAADNVPRNQWRIGLVKDTYPGKDQLVRSALVKIGTSELVRPIVKLGLLEGAS